jgi:2-oxoglutarate ferredoxin oxidoreductase subunit beta
MNNLLNKSRPLVFCPGCSHERIARILDKSFQNMGLKGNQIVMVSDIGCSGLFDTFFHTHALHGLHGRALTYATGIKLARPELNVVVTMGDGGMGIGGAHLLSACRHNLDLTLLVLNNFNFGMTGGQYSATTPTDAQVGSSFLNQLDRPLDVCQVAASAGAAYVTRCSAYRKDLAEEIERAIRHKGFSILDIWGVCTGRYIKRNKLTPQRIDDSLSKLPPRDGIVEKNIREEYGKHYRALASQQKTAQPPGKIEKTLEPPELGRKEVIILGSAGQRIITAGDILCFAGLTAGLKVTQKNEYNITVLRGPSISEVILSPEEIGFTGIEKPAAIVAIGQEGVDRRANLFDHLDKDTFIIVAESIEVPPSHAEVHRVDIKAQGLKTHDWALASLSILAKLNKVISLEMLQSALKARFKGPVLSSALGLVDQVDIA